MRITDKGNKTAGVKFYGEINSWYNNGESFDRMFDDLEAKYDTIDVEIHCYGGSVIEGNVIFNRIAKSKKAVDAYVIGIAASMGSAILPAFRKVYMAENAFIMIHNPSSYTQGNARDHEQTAKLLKDMEANFAKAYGSKTGKPEEEVKGWFDGSDHWFNATEAKAIGLADEIIPMVAADIKDLSKPEGSADIKMLYDRYAASLTTEIPQPKSSKNTSTMKKDLIEKFNLEGVTEASSDTAILDALSSKMSALERTAKASLEAQITAQIEAAEKTAGVTFTDEQKVSFKAIGEKAGLDSLKAALSFVKPAQAPAATATATISAAIASAAAAPSADNRSKWTWNDYQEKDVKALEAMEKTDWANFSALYKNEFGVEPKR